MTRFIGTRIRREVMVEYCCYICGLLRRNWVKRTEVYGEDDGSWKLGAEYGYANLPEGSDRHVPGVKGQTWDITCFAPHLTQVWLVFPISFRNRCTVPESRHRRKARINKPRIIFCWKTSQLPATYSPHITVPYPQMSSQSITR